MRENTTEIGRRAEKAVCDFLTAQGALIYGTNLRAGRGEIDVLAIHAPLALVVEVRTRGPGSFASAFESITRDKRRRIVSAARVLWRTRLKEKVAGVEGLRFDVASVTLGLGDPIVDYVKGAFTEADT